tara:strand:- start:92 stop:604 length:513 start_codon:yes stop_codon:yes gene_type:complete
MKTKYYLQTNLFIALFFLCISCVSNGDIGNDTPENLGRSILHSLQQDDIELFTKYIYTEHEVEYFIKNYKKKLDAESVRDRHKEYYPKLIEAFDKIRKDAVSKGLTNWDDVEFSKVSYSSRMDETEARSTRLEFTNDKFIGIVNLSTIRKSDRGWFMQGMPSFRGYSRMN